MKNYQYLVLVIGLYFLLTILPNSVNAHQVEDTGNYVDDGVAMLVHNPNAEELTILVFFNDIHHESEFEIHDHWRFNEYFHVLFIPANDNRPVYLPTHFQKSFLECTPTPPFDLSFHFWIYDGDDWGSSEVIRETNVPPFPEPNDPVPPFKEIQVPVDLKPNEPGWRLEYVVFHSIVEFEESCLEGSLPDGGPLPPEKDTAKIPKHDEIEVDPESENNDDEQEDEESEPQHAIFSYKLTNGRILESSSNRNDSGSFGSQ